MSCQPWFQTFTGVKFDPRKCKPYDIRIEDMAHALSLYCRFGGHTRFHYSVAQHLCLCHDHGQPGRHPDFIRERKQLLLHDGTEAYLGDVVKPLKALLPDYQRIERRLERMIMRRFGLPLNLLPEVKEIDLIALATEKRDLLVQDVSWPHVAHITPWPERIVPWPCAVAEIEFLSRFYKLWPDPHV